MLHGKNDEKSMFINAAKIAYKLADAMIEVRKISKIEWKHFIQIYNTNEK